MRLIANIGLRERGQSWREMVDADYRWAQSAPVETRACRHDPPRPGSLGSRLEVEGNIEVFVGEPHFIEERRPAEIADAIVRLNAARL